MVFKGQSWLLLIIVTAKVLSLPEYSTEALDLSYYQISSNSIEKPVQETQEYVPPQSVGAAVIPYQPPPATPVNAAASNVPGDGNSVFLGSGSLGVINLGGGKQKLKHFKSCRYQLSYIVHNCIVKWRNWFWWTFYGFWYVT